MKISFRRHGVAVASIALAGSAVFAQDIDSSRAAANELFSDALVRTSELAPAAGVYTPKIGGQVVSRFNLNVRDNPPGFSDLTIGGQIAYMKLNVTGNVLDDSISYRVQVKFDETNGSPILDDAHIDFKLEDEFSLRFGQFKPPVLREENMSDTKQLAANRSVMNGVFSQSRTQGAMLVYTTREMRLMGSVNDGIRTANVDYIANVEADFGLTARFEYKIDGDWKQYDEFTSWRDSKYFGALGAAFHYQEGGDSYGVPSVNDQTDDINLWFLTVDAMAKGNGWNTYAAAVFRQRETPNTVPSTSFDDMGFLVQGGWFVGPKWELFARYDVVIPDNGRALDSNFNTITFGANKYISPNSHAVKLTFDIQWFIDKQSAQSLVSQSTLTGVLTSVERGQFAVRAQLQLVF